MKDRPRLGAILEAHANLRGWITAQFDTSRAGYLMLWDQMEPVSGRGAEHEYPSFPGAVEAETAVVRVSSRSTGWDQLTGLVFELHNFRGAPRFEEIHQAAVSGAIGKSAYARQCLEQEFVARQATKEFLQQHVAILPGAGRDESRRYWQVLHADESLDTLLRESRRRGQDLAHHYEVLYEQEVVPEMKRASR